MIRVEFSGVGLLVVAPKEQRARFVMLDVEKTGGKRHQPVLAIEEHQQLAGAPPDIVVTIPGHARPLGVWRLADTTVELTPGETNASLRPDLSATQPLIDPKKLKMPEEWRSLRRLPSMNHVAQPTSNLLRETFVAADVTMLAGNLSAQMPREHEDATYNFDLAGKPIFPSDHHWTGQFAWTFQPAAGTHDLVLRGRFTSRTITVGATCEMAVSNLCLGSPAFAHEVEPVDIERTYELVSASRTPRLRTASIREYPHNINCGNFLMEI